jgi:hypothetical protein
MSKDTFYFSHDYNARTDVKIKGLIRKHGMAGYGIFWAIVEDLYNNANALQTDYDGIAYELRTDFEIVKSIINDFDLFSIEGGSFGSKSVERRLDERNEKSKKARESAFKRWSKDKPVNILNANASKNDAEAMRSESRSNAIKKSIEKENKGNDIKQNVNVSFENFLKLYDKNVEQENCESLWNNLTEREKIACLEYIPAYIKLKPNKRFRKKSLDYLKNKNWENKTPSFPSIPAPVTNSQDIPPDTHETKQIFKPPTLDEVSAYCNERNNGIDPIAFLNHYEAVGWRYGKGPGKPIKDWKACVRTWEDRKKKEVHEKGIDRGQRPGQVVVDGSVPASFKK